MTKNISKQGKLGARKLKKNYVTVKTSQNLKTKPKNKSAVGGGEEIKKKPTT